MTDQYKRNTIKGLGLVAASAAVSGCAVFDWLKGTKPPRAINCSDNTYAVFDAHAHFFNASDLNAGRYLAGPVANDLVKYENSETLVKLMKFAGNIIQSAGNKIAPSADQELLSLRSDKQIKSLQLESANNFSYVNNEDYMRASEDFYHVAKDSGKAVEFNQLLLEAKTEEIIKAQEKGIFLESEQMAIPTFSDTTLLNAIQRQNLPQLKRQPKALSQQIKHGILSIDDVTAFLLRILSKRTTNLGEYQYRFSTAANQGKSPIVIGATDVLVDFDYWLGVENHDSSIESQIELHAEIRNRYGNFTVPILGVNPIKVITKGTAYIKLIKRAFQQYGFSGVKLYPTLGYSPNGDLHSDMNGRFEKGDLPSIPSTKQVKDALYKIYEVCLESDAIVMTHASRGKGITKSATEYASYKYWQPVLERFPNLKVNFGHLGGNKDSDWNKGFLNLLASSKYPNVYGDLGYWFENKNKADLVNLFTYMRTLDQGVFDKVLYGTDFFMMTTENDWDSYLNWTYENVGQLVSEKIISAEEMDALFYKNSKRLFAESVNSCASAIGNR